MLKKIISLSLIIFMVISCIEACSAWLVDVPLNVKYVSVGTSHLFTMDIIDPDNGNSIVHDVVDANILNEEKKYMGNPNIPDKLLKVKVNSKAWRMIGINSYRWENVGTTKEDTFQISKTNTLEFKTTGDTIWNGGHLKINKYNT